MICEFTRLINIFSDCCRESYVLENQLSVDIVLLTESLSRLLVLFTVILSEDNLRRLVLLRVLTNKRLHLLIELPRFPQRASRLLDHLRLLHHIRLLNSDLLQFVNVFLLDIFIVNPISKT